MKNILILLLVPLAVGLAFPSAGKGDQASTLMKILTTHDLWGEDFPAALAFLQVWDRIGERTVAIFPDRVVGTKPFKTADDAQQTRRAMTEVLSKPRPQATPYFEELLKGLTGQPAPFQTDVVQLSDDDSYRVAITGRGLRLLPQSLTVKHVEELIGQPDAVTTQVIQGERDRRPVTLTLRSYAGGAVVYGESDLAPTPGLVDRVTLNVRVVTPVLFRGRQ